ncbi:hypothetical protein [Streptomyces sp. OE57]|uniref:hypothetical protein n=1 Tax=Streptomyces lacaronensis TaxID=3379885 RepID=UPI0039B739C0
MEELDAGSSPRARADAQDVLRDEIEADPELRRQLEMHLSTLSTRTENSVVITGGRLSRSPISLGPLTINNTPSARALLVAATALLLALLALGVYGGVQLLTPDDSPKSSRQSEPSDAPSGALSGNEGSGGTTPPSESGGADRKNTALNEAAVVEVTLPDSGSLPSGWEATQDKEINAGVPSDCSSCTGALYTGTVPFENTDSGEAALFYIQAYDTADHAAQRFDDVRAGKDEHSDGLEPMSLQPMGDKSVAYRAKIVNAGRAEAGVLVGTVVTWVTYRTPDSSLDPAALSSFAQMLAERAQQAQDGTIPPVARVEF